MGAPKFTPAGIRRAIEGIREAGDEPAAVEFRPDGTFVVRLVRGDEPTLALSPPAPGAEDEAAWDAALGTGR